MEHSPGFLKLVEDARAGVRELTIAQLRERLARKEPVVLVDVREDHEWEKGRIPGARHLGRGVLERDIEKLYPDRGAELILYCGGGFRSALAAESIQKMGYRNVLSLAGGFRGWRESGAAVEGPGA
ncbi:MAG TPA: rhodanese-like domain-containing protein [Elusimicrobiota bacterium]|nr:rhodanese-like domain-containing protein [Elusimicrobiota bacterium]